MLVNFKELKKKVGIGPQELFEGLTRLINETFKEFYEKRSNAPKIILKDYRKGEWSISFPEATEDEVSGIYSLLKDSIKKYFIKNKIEDIFINLGILAYFPDTQNPPVEKSPCNIFIKKVYIGSEIRRFKRVGYKTVVGVNFSGDKTVYSQTVDISKGGLCFVSEQRFETDEHIVVKLKSPDGKRSLDIKARIAWRKNISEGSKELSNMYKTGVEFIGLKEVDRKELSELIQSISA